MKGKIVLYCDQHGKIVFARTMKELHAKAGPGRVFKIYRDKKDGSTVHVGYGVGRRWFDAFAPIEIAA